MTVTWSEEAILDLDHLFTWAGGSTAAQRLVDRIRRRGLQLELFPLSGRVVPEFNVPQIRELIERPYRIIYRVSGDQVDIFMVVHGAMDLTDSRKA